MAIKHAATTAGASRAVDSDMTVEEFKEWLRRFDADKDGRISQEELRRAIRSIKGRFTGWRSARGMRYADADGDGFIDDSEIDNLVKFAQTKLGLKIASY